jgi:hypothetical protein
MTDRAEPPDEPMAPENTAELYMQARWQLDRVADSMSSGPTSQSVLILRLLQSTVAKLLVRAAEELSVTEANERDRIARQGAAS